jgi:hypothetical protein
MRAPVVAVLLCALASCANPPAAHADPQAILFVGNSYTFGRVDPVMSYRTDAVHDLTQAFWEADPSGTNPWEPHPWGGVPGLFKQFTVEAGLDYDVSISARNAATLRGHYLNSASPAWDLRGNVASRRWDVVVLQDQSDIALPAGKGKNANLAQFEAYLGLWEDYIHVGDARTYTETELYGSLEACEATGLSATSCGIERDIPANANASSGTRIYLTQTWARPDMVFAHKNTIADPDTPDGSPIPDPAGTDATLYFKELAGMTRALHASFQDAMRQHPAFVGLLHVGDAFQLAVHEGAQRGGFYDASGLFVPDPVGGPIDLWWKDRLHASLYGSYLDALVQFGAITGRDPRSLGANEQAARDLGMTPSQAKFLQRVAAATLESQGRR